ncbi:hypothetical protein SteCoe_16319 [Stentor coeruleus]|uniref:Uncharacterized protein n=1 Tax=Stentor coeruleus TaxID=5963 RepID=A0A1R2C1E5_9CILI|nr:hypothetical protein SteCoe_16319 [Stentor coeruleus]
MHILHWILIICGVVFSKDMLEQETDLTIELIKKLENKIEKLEEIRSNLLSSGTSIPIGDTWKSWLEPQDSLPNRFHLSTSVALSSNIVDFDFLAHRIWKIPSLAICTKDGRILVYTAEGILFKEIQTGNEILYCSCSTSSEELIIGSVDTQYLHVHSISLNTTQINTISIITEKKLFDTDEVIPCSLNYYVRVGKKMWIIGDSKGGITVFSHDGEFIDRVNTNIGPILTIATLGQQLIVSGKKRIGVFNTASMEFTTLCYEMVSDIYSIALDNTPAIVFVSMENGEVIVLDTRYSINNGPAYCKAVYRLVGKFPGHLASIQGNLLLWNTGNIIAFNTTFLEIDATVMPQYYSLPMKISHLAKSYRGNSNNIVALSSNDEIRLYNIQSPEIRTIQASSSSNFDLGAFRWVIVLVIIVIFVVYKAKNRKTRKELEVEQLEKSLEELQASMESTSKISEDLTSRFKTVEESTKQLRGFERFAKKNSDSD